MFAFLVKNGRVAEWLGRGLQNLVQQFKSARDLRVRAPQFWGAFLFGLIFLTFDIESS